MEAQDRYVPPFRPHPRSRRTGDQTPPPPLLTREPQEEGACPPFARNGGATGIPPIVHMRTGHTGQAPQPPLPFARKGSAGTRCGTGQDGMGEGTRNAPSPPLTWDRARNARGDATASLPVCAQRQHANEGRTGRRERARLHTLSAAPPFACGQRANGGARPPGAAPPSPRVGARGQHANRNAQKRQDPPFVPTPLFAWERGSRTGRVRANPERRPLSLLHRSDA
ncbi:hypothetical protein EDB85DRAFT_2222804 [Lactarius pseudohatsudake]|nr:hypothetical protein EDB85DRAFT_2222804 [Lactarius pseudohatsudake]